MPWHKRDDDYAASTSRLHSADPYVSGEPARSPTSPILIALGIVLAGGGGALLSTVGTTGLDGLLNVAGLSRLALADVQQQQADAIASLDGKVSAVMAELAAFKSRSNVLARTSAGSVDGLSKFDAEFATLRNGIDSLATETAYLDMRVEAVAKRAEMASNDRIAKLDADVDTLKNEIAAVRALHSEPGMARGPVVGRLDGFEAGLALAESDIAGLRSSVDAYGAKNRGDIAAISQRIDKIESAIGSELTGSLGRTPARKRRGVAGWSLQQVTNGKAVIRGRAGTFEVGQGAIVPGLGRIDAIKQQGNHWVVATSRGSIVGRTAPPSPLLTTQN
jgi:hypothetical protein